MDRGDTGDKGDKGTGENRNTSNGDYSNISGGFLNTSDGNYSCVPGGYTNTSEGDYNTDPYSCAIGKYNFSGSISGNPRIFMVGYGTGNELNVFSILSNGDYYAAGTLQAGPADYAEW